MPDLSSRLRDLRKLKGDTQEKLSNFLGVTAQAYPKYEYGLRKPNLETTIKLANYFNVSVDYLLGLTDNPERNL